MNLPSASAYAITEACPGSENLIRNSGLESVIEVPDEQAERGTRIHKAWETGDTSDLSQDEQEDYTTSIKLVQDVLGDWKFSVDARGLDITEIREERLWLHDQFTMEPLLSGQFDKLYITGRYGLVLDLKSGWCRNLTRADTNRQLRVLAVLVWKEYGITNIQAEFIKPKIFKAKTDPVSYNEGSLIHAEAQIIHSLWKSKQPEAQRVPGSHCTYCKAKGICPEAGAYSMLPSVMVNAIETPDRQEIINRMATEDLAMILSRSSQIIGIIDAVKKRLKSLPTEELKRVGLEIDNGKKLDPITDAKGAFEALKSFGIAEGELWAALNFGKGDLTRAVMRDQGWAKDKTEGWLYEQILKPFITQKRSEGSLKRIE